MSEIKPGLYRHYKGDVYRLNHVATNIGGGKPWTDYTRLRDGTHWVRPLSEFVGTKHLPGEFVPRFTLIEADDEPISPEWVLFVTGKPVRPGALWYEIERIEISKNQDVAYYGGKHIGKPTTVGAVRRLCEALGIELKVPE